jgi:hypothetical protein
MIQHLGVSDMQFKVFYTFCQNSWQLPRDTFSQNLLIIFALHSDVVSQWQDNLWKLLSSSVFPAL